MVDDETLAGPPRSGGDAGDERGGDGDETLAQERPFASQSAPTAGAPRPAETEQVPVARGADPQAHPTESVRRDAQATRDGSSELSDRIEAALDESEAPYVQEDPLLGRTIANRFVIESKVGAGGMGAVYRASQLGMDRHVAIKVLLNEYTQNPMIIKRFHMEALAVSKLEHPNTIRIFDFGQTADGVLFIAMEFLQGRALEHELRQHKTIPVRRAMRILAQTCRSLAEAHDKGIVHRDLKPDNIFLLRVGDDPDFVKVLDFGVAKLKAEDKRMGTLTQAGMVFGTPKYMSPEQSRSDITDARADVYALGVILYEMVTGRAPFDADNPLSILIQHVQDVVPPPSSVRPDLVIPTSVEAIILRCLEKDADARYQGARGLAEALEAAERELDEAFEQVLTRSDAQGLGLDVPSAEASSRSAAFTAQRSGPPRPGQDDETTPMSAEEARPLMEAMRRRKRWRRVFVGAAALLVAAGAALVAVLLNLPGTPPGFSRLFAEQASPLAELGPLALDTVTVTLRSTPTGATVYRDDKPLGRTPLRLERTRRPDEEVLPVRLEGFVSGTLEVNYGKDAEFVVALEKQKPKVVTVTKEVPVRPKPGRPGKPSKPAPTEPKKPATFLGGKVDDIK